MRRTACVLIGLWILGAVLAAPAADGAALQSGVPAATGTPSPEVAADLRTRINILRASLGLWGYTVNEALNAAAQDQALWMVSSGLVAHVRPDGSTPAQRALAAGYPESWSCSEIIYMGGIATLDDAWAFWLSSPVHYAELTSARHQEMGIGIASSQRFGQAFVVVFGKFGAPGTAQPGTYVVQPGDTLAGIARRYGLPPETLAAANHLLEQDELAVGQVLVIPQTGTPTPTVAASVTPARSPVYHVVQRGETLFQIARAYGVALDSLIAANNLVNPDRIEIGQVLVIP